MWWICFSRWSTRNWLCEDLEKPLWWEVVPTVRIRPVQVNQEPVVDSMVQGWVGTNGVALKRQQDITWTNDNQDLLHHMMSQGHNDLNIQ